MKKELKLINRIISGIILGIFAGLVVCIYRYLISVCDKLLNQFIFPLLHQRHPLFFLIWSAILIILARLVYHVIHWEPDAEGGGIPHTVQEINGKSDSRWWSVLIAKLISAPLCILAGFSLGKTGPAIELGSMSAKGVHHFLRRILANSKSLPTTQEFSYAGAGAGLSALFNAPLAGIFFAFEKYSAASTYSPLTTTIAVLAAFFISVLDSGFSPIMDISIPSLELKYYPILALFGILLGVLGQFYANSLQISTKILTRNKEKSGKSRWIFVFLLAGILGYFFPAITGGGTNMLALVTDNRTAVSTLLLLLIGKYFFSMISSGTGLPGGTVFPLLTVGACIGQIWGLFACLLFPGMNLTSAAFILCGMSGFFASVIGTPITGIFLMCEFSCNYSNFLPLCVICVFSHLASRFINLLFPHKL